MLIDILHDICNPFANIGLWITTIDLYVDIERYLVFDQNDQFGMCKRECETISRACTEVLSDFGEEIAEWIWLNKAWIGKESMRDYICDQHCPEDKLRVKKKKKERGAKRRSRWGIPPG